MGTPNFIWSYSRIFCGMDNSWGQSDNPKQSMVPHHETTFSSDLMTMEGSKDLKRLSIFIIHVIVGVVARVGIVTWTLFLAKMDFVNWSRTPPCKDARKKIIIHFYP